jgi:hypothetical protein
LCSQLRPGDLKPLTAWKLWFSHEAYVAIEPAKPGNSLRAISAVALQLEVVRVNLRLTDSEGDVDLRCVTDDVLPAVHDEALSKAHGRYWGVSSTPVVGWVRSGGQCSRRASSPKPGPR